jgi:hypothetical protein
MGIKLTASHTGEGEGSTPFFEKAFTEDRITIGNHSAASLRLNGSVVADEQLVIIDCLLEPKIINRAEGTSLNGERLALNELRYLRDRDLLTIGTYLIDVSVYADEQSPGIVDEPVNGNRDYATLDSGFLESNDPGGEDFSAIAPDESTAARLGADFTDPFLPEFDRRLAPSKSFAAILDGLRTDEDRFYFLLEGGRQSGTRVSIESEEMPLGWHVNGEYITCELAAISSILAIVRKDWSGVMLQPQTSGVAVNGEVVVDVGRRLRDGDRVALGQRPAGMDRAKEPVLVFHEPASLVILDSLMPRPLPHEIDPQISSGNGHARTTGKVHHSMQKVADLLRNNTEYFGAFTFVELSLMALGTVVGAFIIFLILNYS